MPYVRRGMKQVGCNQRMIRMVRGPIRVTCRMAEGTATYSPNKRELDKDVKLPSSILKVTGQSSKHIPQEQRGQRRDSEWGF